MKIAINQPYLSPYAAYYALMRHADIFVIYDCVQFTRRGRIHRSQIHKTNYFSDGWLTLPIIKAPQKTAIKDIRLRSINDFMAENPTQLTVPLTERMNIETYRNDSTRLVDFLEEHNKVVAQKLNITTKIIRSSTLNIPEHIYGTQRILEICKKLGAKTYLNLPGGKDLYNKQDFQQANIELKFINADQTSRLGYAQACAENLFDKFLKESTIARFE